MQDALSNLNVPACKNLIVGFDTSDDAAVFNHNGTLLVQTVDVIAPIVDDPYTFGRIAAVNAISDIYAMGGKPITALSVMMYPCHIGNHVAGIMMQGAIDECTDSGCVLCGGHTLQNDEVRLGLSVTGVIDGDRIYQNSTLKPNHKLILTKPIGSGIISTAVKAGFAKDNEIEEMTACLLKSNRDASEIMKKYDVSACTDVTGFGLGGHAIEMAISSNTNITVYSSKIPMLSNIPEYSRMGIVPAGAYNNQNFGAKNFITELPKEIITLTFDPQTCGGLLIGVSEKDADNLLKELINKGYSSAAIIGQCEKGEGKLILEK